MDPYHERGFQYNIDGYLNTEIFNYSYRTNPNYGLMDQPEIPVGQPQYYRHYPSSSNQQMNQLYYDNDQYGNHGCHSPRRDHNYPYAPQETPFELNQIELPSNQISADIRLSSRGYINNQLIHGLEREGLRCDVRDSVITVTGYPSNNRYGHGFLEIVKAISGDRRASLER